MKILLNLALTSALIFLSGATFAESNLNQGLLGWYQFEQNTLDSSSNSNHGTGYGDLTYTNGIFGQAAHFNESLSTYVMTQSDVKLDTPSYAISTYFRITQYYGSWEKLVSRQLDSTTSWDDSWDVVLYGSGNTGSLGYWNHTTGQGTVFTQTATTILANEWHSTIVNVNNGEGSIYLDGAKVGAFTQVGVNYSPDNVPVCIGCNDYNQGTPQHFLNGDLDELRLYGRSLNNDEIAILSSLTAPVPETNTNLMLLIGLGLFGFMARRRKHVAA